MHDPILERRVNCCDAEWLDHGAQRTPVPETSNPVGHRGKRPFAPGDPMALLVLGVGTKGSDLWPDILGGHKLAEQSLRVAVEQDAAQFAALPEFVRTVGPDGWSIEIVRTELRNRQALVELRLRAPRVPPRTYRTTRFYRHISAGWQETAPVESFWGPLDRLETGHFVLDYRQIDAAAVTEAALRLDDLVETKYRPLDPLSVMAPTRFEVQILPARVQLSGKLTPKNDKLLTMSLPQLALVPAALIDADVLYEAIVTVLAQSIVIALRNRLRADPSSGEP